MARSPILTLAADVADDTGLRRPVSLFASYDEGDTTDLKIKRALIKTSRFLHAYWHWSIIRADVTFTSLTNGVQTNILPADFQRFVQGSFVDVARQEPAGRVSSFMPLAPGETPWRLQYAVIGTALHLRSPYPAGQSMAFSYCRDILAEAANGTRKAAFTADDDKALWSDELMHLGMVWAVKNRDGDRTSEDYSDFVSRLGEEMNHEAPDGDLVFGDVVERELLPPRLPTGAW